MRRNRIIIITLACNLKNYLIAKNIPNFRIVARVTIIHLVTKIALAKHQADILKLSLVLDFFYLDLWAMLANHRADSILITRPNFVHIFHSGYVLNAHPTHRFCLRLNGFPAINKTEIFKNLFQFRNVKLFGALHHATAKHIPVKAELIINPGSEMIRYTAERDGILEDLRKIGGGGS